MSACMCTVFGPMDIILHLDSLGSKAPFIPMKIGQWCLEAKKAWLPSYENPWIVSVVWLSRLLLT